MRGEGERLRRHGIETRGRGQPNAGAEIVVRLHQRYVGRGPITVGAVPDDELPPDTPTPPAPPPPLGPVIDPDSPL